MIRKHGPYTQRDGFTDGWPKLRNAAGDSWHQYVFGRVTFDAVGNVVELFEDDGETPIEIGTRFFGHVFTNDADNTIFRVTDNITKGDPIDAYVIETDEPIVAGMRYVDGAILPALPAPYVPITIGADVLFGRMTDDEYDALDTSVRTGETSRVYRSFSATNSFSEGSAMWDLLRTHLNELVSEARLAVLLARPA